MEKIIAEILLNTKSVFLRVDKPFTWASGIKSPIYCDNRRILAFPDKRELVKNAFIKVLETLEFDAIMGTATAGIPMASILADALNKPLGYVRSSNKEHGRNNQIEGFCEPGSKVVVIEDLISTGGSVVEVVNALREAKIEVVQVVAIFTYELEVAREKMKGIDYTTLSNYTALIHIAKEMNYIKEEDLIPLVQFQKNPKDSSWMK